MTFWRLYCVNKTRNFVIKARRKHGLEYDYRNVVYIHSKSKVSIRCRRHGVFEQRASNHLLGKGCSKCRYESFTATTEQFVSKAQEKHGNAYDYSLVKYVNNNTKVKIRCRMHGIFEQRASSHLSGVGCPKCFNESLTTTPEQFVSRAQEKHNNAYDYSSLKYVNNKSKVSIRCRRHGIFEQNAHSHLLGRGCPKCANYGFNADGAAFFYACIITDFRGKGFVGYGITNSTRNRFREHSSNLKNTGYAITNKWKYKFLKGEDALRLENSIKEYRDEHISTNIEGFKTEAIKLQRKKAFLNYIRKQINRIR